MLMPFLFAVLCDCLSLNSSYYIFLMESDFTDFYVSSDYGMQWGQSEGSLRITANELILL